MLRFTRINFWSDILNEVICASQLLLQTSKSRRNNTQVLATQCQLLFCYILVLMISWHWLQDWDHWWHQTLHGHFIFITLRIRRKSFSYLLFASAEYVVLEPRLFCPHFHRCLSLQSQRRNTRNSMKVKNRTTDIVNSLLASQILITIF